MMLQSRSLVLPLLFAAIRMANFAVIGVESFTVTRPPSLHMRRHKANGSIHGKSSILIATSSSATYRGPNWEAATRRTSSLHGIDQTKLVDEEIMTAQGKDLFVWSKQWYPVIPLSYLLDKPFPFRLLGRNLVAWKSEDGSIFTVMEDECPHRKAPLSTGKIVDGCNIMCRYHGWQFDTDGKCTNIPMFPIFDGDDGSKLKSFINKDVFHARSFPTKAAGGLLWTYLGVGETEAGPIPNEALMPEELLENLGWFAYSFPVSYMSMVENSFDPSHAPFIHEGVTFSPEGATPMLKYKLLDNTTMSTSGFTMEHSPYQKNDTSHTIRKFTSPSSQKTISPFFPSGIYLYFVPSGPRETLTITALPLPKIKFSRFIPHSLREMMYDGAHFSFFTSKSNHRFVMQDIFTMQGQDTRKLISTKFDVGKVILDMAPTPSDAGINMFQRWVRKFGGGGPFSDPSAIVSLESLAQPGPGSLWQLHGNKCPRCQRMVSRASTLEKSAGRASSVLLVATAVLAVVKARVGQKLTMPLAGVAMVAVLQLIGRWAGQAHEKMHRVINIDAISDVYAY